MPFLLLLVICFLWFACAGPSRAGDSSTGTAIPTSFSPPANSTVISSTSAPPGSLSPAVRITTEPAVIWSGLVLATNDAHPAEVPGCLAKYAEKLKNIFGYNQFELIGEYSERMDDPYERWLIPSKDFSLSVHAHNAAGEHYPTKIVLFQNRRRLAEFEAHLTADSPLFIRGPLYAGGQLIIVLHVAEPGEASVLRAH